ncbi:Hypothetical protein SRAE_1000301500 [Strongyloides ratti]|uniref:Uncharacterized protein n=1 Tax=Strongyloides ratti TaxID=34506 RepID=A0A090L4Y3_STRRB|nr:Hypothetical protein SRAE_1000301500 [Strongyloides ratti]CEF64762.1 Hypothetical protein SRAE_1000301500 [Strongyloides ratti]
MKDKEKKSSSEKKKRHSKYEKNKNKKSTLKPSKIGDKPVKVHKSKKEKINDKIEDFHTSLRDHDDNIYKSSKNNYNIKKEIPTEGINNINDKQNPVKNLNLTNKINNQNSIKEKSEIETEIHDNNNTSPTLRNRKQKLNTKKVVRLIENESSKKRGKHSLNDTDKKEIKIKRTPKDYGIGQYSSIKIQTKNVNGKLFHDVNIQTFDQSKSLINQSQNLHVPFYKKNGLCSIRKNNINQNYSQLLKAKVSKKLQLNEKDIILAKIHHLRKVVDKINNKCIYQH